MLISFFRHVRCWLVVPRSLEGVIWAASLVLVYPNIALRYAVVFPGFQLIRLFALRLHGTRAACLCTGTHDCPVLIARQIRRAYCREEATAPLRHSIT